MFNVPSYVASWPTRAGRAAPPLVESCRPAGDTRLPQ
jgi:hypothetical protein